MALSQPDPPGDLHAAQHRSARPRSRLRGRAWRLQPGLQRARPRVVLGRAHLSSSLKTCAGDKHCVQAYIEATSRTCCGPTTAGSSPKRDRERAPPPERRPRRTEDARKREARDAAPAQGVRVGRPAPELRARRRRAAPDAARDLGPDQEARGARRRRALRAGRQEDPPHRRRCRPARHRRARSSSSSRSPSTR